MHRLLPGPQAAVSVEDAYRAPLGTGDGRPWVSLCMVASIDGSAVVDGLSAQLSSNTDSAVFLQLRRLADVIIVGAGTVRAEGYGAPSTPGQRIGVVTRSGNVPLESDLFTSGAGFVITAESAPEFGGGVDVVRVGDDAVDLHQAVRRLDQVAPGCTVVQVEGGPALNAAMIEADLFDELDITTSPLAAGGPGARLAAGALPVTQRFDLAQLAVDDQSFVFSRWLRRRGG